MNEYSDKGTLMTIELAEKPYTGKQILNIPMQPNDAGALTIGDYLVELLSCLFNDGEGFSAKRPFGNSGWEMELHHALVIHGVIEGIVDEQGYLESYNEDKAITAIFRAIESLYKVPKKLQK